jgi:hypothetical protein
MTNSDKEIENIFAAMEHEVWSPFDAAEAAFILLKMLAEKPESNPAKVVRQRDSMRCSKQRASDED